MLLDLPQSDPATDWLWISDLHFHFHVLCICKKDIQNPCSFSKSAKNLQLKHFLCHYLVANLNIKKLNLLKSIKCFIQIVTFVTLLTWWTQFVPDNKQFFLKGFNIFNRPTHHTWGMWHDFELIRVLISAKVERCCKRISCAQIVTLDSGPQLYKWWATFLSITEVAFKMKHTV